jgi:hypothetical protein
MADPAAKPAPPASPKPPAAGKPPVKPAAGPAAPEKPQISPILKDRLRTLYVNRIRPFLEGRTDPELGDADVAQREFTDWKATLPGDFHPVLDELEAACQMRRQMARQQKLHGWLHGWLQLHVPLSMALFVLLIIHIVAALRVIPF